MFFFSRPAVKPSDDEKVALSEFIKGRHSLPSVYLTSKRLTCPRCPSMGRVSMKVYANGYIHGKYFRMKCSYSDNGNQGAHTFGALELWYQVTNVPEELHTALNWIAEEYPAPDNAVVVCRPCPVKYATPEELKDIGRDDEEDIEPEGGILVSPKGINYRDLGRLSESPIESSSRQISFDQSEEEWIEVKRKK